MQQAYERGHSTSGRAGIFAKTVSASVLLLNHVGGSIDNDPGGGWSLADEAARAAAATVTKSNMSSSRQRNDSDRCDNTRPKSSSSQEVVVATAQDFMQVSVPHGGFVNLVGSND